MDFQSILIFDGDCAFCTRCVEWGLEHLDAFPAVVASQRFTDEQLAVRALDRNRVASQVYLLLPNATQLGGARAVAGLLRLQPALRWRVIGAVLDFPPVRPIASWGYRLVARNRHRLPGASESCAL